MRLLVTPQSRRGRVVTLVSRGVLIRFRLRMFMRFESVVFPCPS